MGLAEEHEGRGDGPHLGGLGAGPGHRRWVWDGAGGHKDQEVQALAAPRVVQPPYAPELNPVERFFQELRQALEGRVYPDLQAKQAALEPILNVWQADPERVKQLCGWIRDTLEALPADTQAVLQCGCQAGYGTYCGWPRWYYRHRRR